jgi:DNA-binding XRE family transcriptional regulator
MNGERHSQAKLTEEQVVQIRERNAAGEIQRVLADEFGVSKATISHIVTGRNWAHLEGAREARRIGSSTHCKHGHEWTEENTYVRKDGYRMCRACGKDSAVRRSERLVTSAKEAA